jgi:hypothetical protein
VKRAEPYLQHDTTPKWDVLTFFEATLLISLSADIDIGRQAGGAALEGGVVF